MMKPIHHIVVAYNLNNFVLCLLYYSPQERSSCVCRILHCPLFAFQMGFSVTA